MNSISDFLIKSVSRWLRKQSPPKRAYLSDFERVRHEVQPGDVILIEGRSRASTIIKQITQSAWSHAALYLGHLDNIHNPKLRSVVEQQVQSFPEEQIIVESEIGLGTILSPLTKYQEDHIRIMRPRGLAQQDLQKIFHFAVSRIGRKYDIRHLLDLARFLFPWGIYPRKWRSSLFQHNALQPTEDICSSMIAYAFQSVHFPILPLVREDEDMQYEFIERNPRLYTPSDFDYSPYFDVIKYPIYPRSTQGDYRQLPWREDLLSDDKGMFETLQKMQHDNVAEQIKTFFTSKLYAVVGASRHPEKFGNKVLRCYIENHKDVIPVHPHEKMVEGLHCVKNVSELPDECRSISIVTPPPITEKIVEAAIQKGISNIWIQPGAESLKAINQCKAHHINVIAGGPCILIELGFLE